MEPLLSIVTITYNHEPYIQKCIEGVLMQQVNFPIEFIIAEDCSTDGTLAICKEYAEKYPDLIQLITSDNNVGAIANERRAMKAAKGKYIAFCEGDDYWTDSLKLQKQVDFMESNPEYSVCFHRFIKNDIYSKQEIKDTCGYKLNEDTIGVDINIESFFNRWKTQPLTMVIRKCNLNIDLSYNYKFFCDTIQIYHLLKKGKGFLFFFYGGVYNLTHQGDFTSKTEIEMMEGINRVHSELLEKTNDSEVKKAYLKGLQFYLDLRCQKRTNNFKEKFTLLKVAFILFIRSFNSFKLLKNLRLIFFK